MDLKEKALFVLLIAAALLLRVKDITRLFKPNPLIQQQMPQMQVVPDQTMADQTAAGNYAPV